MYPWQSTRILLAIQFALLLVIYAVPESVNAAPGDSLFSDDFESGFGNWTENSFDGGDASIGTETSNSPNSSMRLRWDGVTATSTTINTAVPAAELSAWIRRGDDSFSENPENNEDLILEYLDSSNNWQTLETFDGGGTPGEILNRVYPLPADALHSSLRIRFTLVNGNGSDFDYWHVDDVEVTETEPPPPLEYGTCDDFENNLSNWSISGIGDVSIGTETSNSPNSSMRLRWDTVTATSIAIDMDQPVGVLQVWIRRGDNSFSDRPENNEDLVLEYLNSSSNWVTLETFPGGNPGGAIFDRSYTLPANALHSNFQIRFRFLRGNGSDFDYWHVDDVCLVDPLEAAYYMDESQWDGTAGEVEDASGNDRHGTAVNGATTAAANPAIGGSPGTCSYGTFDGSNDYVQINNLSSLLNGTASLAFWINTTQTGNNTGWRAPGVAGVEEAGGADDIFWGWLDASGRIGISVGNDYAADQKSSTQVNDGNWHHVVLTRNASTGATQIFIDGTLETSGSSGTGVIGNSYTSIGRIEDTGGSPEYFNGQLDEVRVYSEVLNATAAGRIMNLTRPCRIIDHFNFSVGASASTCTAQPVTITARDAADNLLTSYTGTVNISTSTNNGNWSINNGDGVLTPDPDNDDDGAVSYTYDTNDSGTVILGLSNQHAEDLTITVVDNTLPSTASTSGTVSFRDNAFVITEDPLQVAGRPQTIDVAMWRRDSSSGDCAIADLYAGNKTLKAWLMRDVDDPGGAAPTVGGTALPNSVPGSNNLTLNFTAGQASFTLDTTDVGKYAINLRDDSRTFANAVDIDGTSGTLTERPFALAFTNINAGGTANPAAAAPSGSIFTTAGSNFAFTLGAYLWQSADDGNDDGIPDAGTDITNNGLTPSYAWDTTVSAVQNTPSAGVGGVLGTLNNADQVAADFSGGSAAPTDIQYMEVGSILMSASATDYLNTSGVNVGGNSQYNGSSGVVGRFAADHFEFTVNTAPEFAAGCGNFTYIDQPFDFSSTPQITAHAMAFNDATPLQNYHDFTGSGGGDWWKLDLDPVTGGVDPVYSDGSIAAELVLDDAASGYAPISGSGTNGSIQFSLSGPLTYADRNAAAYGPVAPFDADIRLDFTVTDDDTATGTRVFDPVSFPQPNQRWGRLRLTNAAGSELLSLSVPLFAEYYDGNAFVTNTDDSCTALDLADDIVLSNPDTAGGAGQPGDSVMTVGGGTSQVTSPDPVQLSSGSTQLIFSAPGEDNTGYIDIVTDLEGAGFTHLQYDWNGDADYSDAGNEPSARATFGIYEGPQEMIYIREPW